IDFICPFPAKMKDCILESIFKRFKGLKPGVIELGLRDSMPVPTSNFCDCRGRRWPGAVEVHSSGPCLPPRCGGGERLPRPPLVQKRQSHCNVDIILVAVADSVGRSGPSTAPNR